VSTPADLDDWLVDPAARRRGGRGAGAVVSLSFLALGLGDVLRDPPPAGQLVLGVAAIVAFSVLWLYVQLLGEAGQTTPRVVGALLVMTGIAVGVALFSPGRSLALFVYIAAGCGLRLSQPHAQIGIVASSAACLVIGEAGGVSFDNYGPLALTTFAIGFLMLGFSRHITVNRELHAARAQLAGLAVTEERLRFSRDLHDLLGHSLSVIALKSELARKLVERDPERAAAEMADINAVTRGALADVRAAVQGYRRLTLPEAIDAARLALKTAGIGCELAAPPPELPRETENVLAWALREATTNVVRHSGARHCEMRVVADGDGAELEVLDDGRGPGVGGDDGSGLRGLRERVARLRGQLDAGPAPGGGFRLRVRIPVRPA